MNNTLLERVEQYVNGELTDEERRLFESDLSTNKELSSLFNLYNGIDSEMAVLQKNHEAKESLKQTLQQLNSVYFDKVRGSQPALPADPDPGAPVKKLWAQPWKVLLAAAVLAGITFLLINTSGSDKNDQPPVVNRKGNTNQAKVDTGTFKKVVPSEETLVKTDTTKTRPAGNKNNRFNDTVRDQLFASSFQPDKSPGDKDGNLEDALILYENKNYRQAIAAIESADLNAETRSSGVDKKTTRFYASYYKGLSYLALNKADKSIPELVAAEGRSPDKLYQSKAQWYLALAYLKVGNLDKCRELLMPLTVIDFKANVKTKAIKLLGALEN